MADADRDVDRHFRSLQDFRSLFGGADTPAEAVSTGELLLKPAGETEWQKL